MAMTMPSGGKRLSELLPGYVRAGTLADVLCYGVETDSRRCDTGCLFVALPTELPELKKYVAHAIDAGCVAVVVEPGLAEQLNYGEKVIVVEVDGLPKKISRIAGNFYAHPSSGLDVIGVTGTNGKTTVTWLIAQVLEKLQQSAAVIGTLGYGRVPDVQSTGYTTPDAVSVQRILASMMDKGIRHVAMEVSSHGLALGRVADVVFSTGVFTNLSHDHLDFHGSIAAYKESKSLLFMLPGLQRAVINIDDEFGSELAGKIKHIPVVSCSLKNEKACCFASNIRYDHSGIKALVHFQGQVTELGLPCLGVFNLSNALLAIASLCSQGFALDAVITALACIDLPPGRMNVIQGAGKTAVVDYAHSPDALKQVLVALRIHTRQRLLCVFGCGGDRDRLKRPLMGRIASEYADAIWVTSDNPRSENPESIIEDICQGVDAGVDISVRVDRYEAIQAAIHAARAGDIVLVAGKGHEAFQEIMGCRYPFSDAQVVREIMAEEGGADAV